MCACAQAATRFRSARSPNQVAKSFDVSTNGEVDCDEPLSWELHRAGTATCDDVVYDPNIHRCCGNTLRTKNNLVDNNLLPIERHGTGSKFCWKELHVAPDQFVCGGQIGSFNTYDKEGRILTESACCDKNIYTTKEQTWDSDNQVTINKLQTCCYNSTTGHYEVMDLGYTDNGNYQVVSGVENLDSPHNSRVCCGGVPTEKGSDSNQSLCCGGELHRAADSINGAAITYGCCAGKVGTNERKSCCGGQFVTSTNKEGETQGFCCGNEDNGQWQTLNELMDYTRYPATPPQQPSDQNMLSVTLKQMCHPCSDTWVPIPAVDKGFDKTVTNLFTAKTNTESETALGDDTAVRALIGADMNGYGVINTQYACCAGEMFRADAAQCIGDLDAEGEIDSFLAKDTPDAELVKRLGPKVLGELVMKASAGLNEDDYNTQIGYLHPHYSTRSYPINDFGLVSIYCGRSAPKVSTV